MTEKCYPEHTWTWWNYDGLHPEPSLDARCDCGKYTWGNRFNDEPEETDLEALHTLARQYCAVSLTIADCGCHTVELFVGPQKISEEDKDLSVVLANVRRRIDEIEGVEIPAERLQAI